MASGQVKSNCLIWLPFILKFSPTWESPQHFSKHEENKKGKHGFLQSPELQDTNCVSVPYCVVWGSLDLNQPLIEAITMTHIPPYHPWAFLLCTRKKAAEGRLPNSGIFCEILWPWITRAPTLFHWLKASCHNEWPRMAKQIYVNIMRCQASSSIM